MVVVKNTVNPRNVFATLRSLSYADQTFEDMVRYHETKLRADYGSGTMKFKAARKEITRRFLKAEGVISIEEEEKMAKEGLGSTQIVRLLLALSEGLEVSRKDMADILSEKFFLTEAIMLAIEEIKCQPCLDVGHFVGLEALDEVESRKEKKE